jgi:hypothetical protein
MPVPYSFKNASGTIPLSQLDDNFATTALSADLAAPAGASSIGIVPTPTIASATVADAINELDTEKATVTSLTSGLALKTNVADLAANTGASLVGFKQTGTGTVARTVDSKSKESVSILDFGAIGDGSSANSAINTAAIQAAIDYMHSLGGGVVEVPQGTYILGSTLVTEDVWYTSVTAKISTRSRFCIVLRSGVTLRGTNSKTCILQSASTAPTVLTMVSMDGGGLEYITICSSWSNLPTDGNGHGVFFCIYNLEDFNQNILINNVIIHSVASYGIGAQWGSYVNNRYNNIYLHNIGADGIDHKVRGPASPVCIGVSFSNIFIENYGKRDGISGQAGIDIRGQVTLVNITAKDFGASTGINVGIRLNASVIEEGTTIKRLSSKQSTLTNFIIYSDPTYPTAGVVLISSPYSNVSNGSIYDCTSYGVSISSTTGGYFDTACVGIENVSVYGARSGSSFYSAIDTSLISFIGCSSISEITEFSNLGGNLVAGQTVFTVDTVASTKVLKNDILLTNITDYTLTSTEVTLVTPVIVTDNIKVIYPTYGGFRIYGTNDKIIGCNTYYNSFPTVTDSTSIKTLSTMSNNFGFNGVRSIDNSAIPILEAYGDTPNLDIYLQAKGTGGVELKSNGGRALRADNVAITSPVNWVSVQGGAAGTPAVVDISGQGSSTNIDFAIRPKGTGNVKFGTLTANADAPITGYITIKDSAGNLRKLAVIA